VRNSQTMAQRVASRYLCGCRFGKVASKKDHILSLFHHIHHEGDEHQVHHCGGRHKGLDYTVEHCPCGKHRINQQEAEGHGTTDGSDLLAVNIVFSDQCPDKDGWWHIESGKVAP